jgi:hypothetical protein
VQDWSEFVQCCNNRLHESGSIHEVCSLISFRLVSLELKFGIDLLHCINLE